MNNETRLSEHFALSEFTHSQTAAKNGINNTPMKWHVENMRNLCTHVLEPLRQQFGKIVINSGFRSERLNDMVGGVGNSRHLYGEAADIRVSDLETGRAYYRFIIKNCPYDQLLFEYNRYGVMWLHVSCKLNFAENRQMAFPNYKATKPISHNLPS